MKLLVNTKIKITKDEIGENVPHLGMRQSSSKTYAYKWND